MTPKRIQRKRSKGWRMPDHTKCVTRPGKWGNPYQIGYVDVCPSFDPVAKRDRENMRGDIDPATAHRLKNTFRLFADARLAIELYRAWLDVQLKDGALDLDELRGWNLSCFCPLGQPCHADILLEMANR